MTEHRIPTVQQYDIRSEADLLPWLELIVREHKISHYRTTTAPDVLGESPIIERLELFWTLPPAPSVVRPTADGIMQFMGSKRVRVNDYYVWNGPSVEAIALNIAAWLSSCEYPPAPDCDGSVEKGWRLCNHGCFQYVEFFVEPHWQEFHK